MRKEMIIGLVVLSAGVVSLFFQADSVNERKHPPKLPERCSVQYAQYVLDNVLLAEGARPLSVKCSGELLCLAYYYPEHAGSGPYYIYERADGHLVGVVGTDHLREWHEGGLCWGGKELLP